MSVDERTFDEAADTILRRLEKSLGDFDPDECDASLAMGVLKIEFRGHSQFVVNSHRAARQVWLAANHQAWHFSYDPNAERWVDPKSGDELLSLLGKLVGEKVGTPVQL